MTRRPQIRMKTACKNRTFLKCAAAVLLVFGLVTLPARGSAIAAETTAGSGHGPAPTLYAPVQQIRIVQTLPHDPAAFTQGLLCSGGFFYESTGLYGKSTIRKVDILTGRVLHQAPLEPEYFGEGLAEWRGRLVQLTWKTHRGFVYSMDSFAREIEFTYPTEGWGLTHDAASLIMSDGTSRLYFLDPESFREKRQLGIMDGPDPVTNLNELEMIHGEIWANIWKQDLIARISPESGKVIAWLDLSGLRDELPLVQQIDVLNGIAYDAEKDRIFVTGKLWPKVFQIEIVEDGKKP